MVGSMVPEAALMMNPVTALMMSTPGLLALGWATGHGFQT
jgi:hypothetical protein